MNERIRELVKQATTYIEPTENSGEGWIFDKEKFAELIVKECVELCDRFQDRDVGMQPAECAGAIKQLFGVK